MEVHQIDMQYNVWGTPTVSALFIKVYHRQIIIILKYSWPWQISSRNTYCRENAVLCIVAFVFWYCHNIMEDQSIRHVL